MSIPIRILQWLSLIPFMITVYGVLNEGILTSAVFKWFLLGVALLSTEFIFGLFKKANKISIPGIGEISINDLENKKVDITALAEHSSGKRFANLAFIVAKDTKRVAMGLHERHKVYLPPGRRLAVHELPHENLVQIIKDQIGLKVTEDQFIGFISPKKIDVYDEKGSTVGYTEFGVSPLWTQLENHEQRLDEDGNPVMAHFDFIFLCVIGHEVDFGPSVRKNPGWFSLEDIGNMLKTGSEKRTFVDVYEGYKEILDFFNKNRGGPSP